jgi:hypothetical protein
MANLLTADRLSRPPIVVATLELTQVDVERYDLKEAVRRLADSGVNAVVVFGIGYLGGEAYYPSEIAPWHRELGSRDFLQEACDVTAEVGIACIGYVNSMFAGPDAYGPHPDWVQARSDGTPTVMADARAMCPNSPYGDRIVQLVAEIAERYPVQGLYLDEPSFQTWCACSYCRAGLYEETRAALPVTADWSSDVWRRFLSWRHLRITRFVGRAQAALKQHRPDAAFLCQHAFPLASTAIPFMRRRFDGVVPGRVPIDVEGWARPLFYGQQLEQIEQHVDVLSAELWRRFVDRPIWWAGTATSYLSSLAGDRPVLAFLEYPNFPWSLQCLPADELAYVIVDVRANGGDPWFPVYAPGESDESGWGTIRETNSSLGTLPSGARPVAEIAVGHSAASSNLASRHDVEAGYFDGVLGTIELLRGSHRSYRVVALDSLRPSMLDGVTHLVLVDSKAMSDETLKVVGGFVEEGGSLVLIGRNATHDADGTPRDRSPLEQLAGVVISKDEQFVELGIAYLDFPRTGVTVPVQGSVPRIQAPSGAEVVGEVRAGYQMFEQPSASGGSIPIVSRVTSKDGQVTWSALNPGLLHRRYRTPRMAEFLSEAAPAWRHDLPVVEGPRTVATYYWSTPGVDPSWSVFLLNETGIDEGGLVIPVGPVSVRVHGRANSEELPAVTTRPAVTHDVKRVGDELVVTIETIGVWAVVQIGADQ